MILEENEHGTNRKREPIRNLKRTFVRKYFIVYFLIIQNKKSHLLLKLIFNDEMLRIFGRFSSLFCRFSGSFRNMTVFENCSIGIQAGRCGSIEKIYKALYTGNKNQ